MASPPWVQSLLDSGLLIPASKFSKYLTGCAALHPTGVSVNPAWFDDPSLAKTLGAAASSAPVADAAHVVDIGDSCMTSPMTQPLLVNSAKHPAPPVRRWRARLSGCWRKGSAGKVAAPKLTATRVKVEPKVFFANERTFIQWVSAGVMLLTCGGRHSISYGRIVASLREA